MNEGGSVKISWQEVLIALSGSTQHLDLVNGCLCSFIMHRDTKRKSMRLSGKFWPVQSQISMRISDFIRLTGMRINGHLLHNKIQFGSGFWVAMRLRGLCD